MAALTPDAAFPVTSADLSDIDFGDIDLDEFAALSPEEVLAKDQEAKKKKEMSKRPADSYCSSEIAKVLMIYPELAKVDDTHWSLILIRLMNRIGYKPKHEMLLRWKHGDDPVKLDALTNLQIVEKHLSKALFDDVIGEILEWAGKHPDDLLLDEEEDKREEQLEASLKVNDGTGLSYQGREIKRENLDQSHEAWGEW